MAEKKSFLNWVGFKESESAAPSSVDRIRELESQLNDLRSRRDITSLSKEEFEDKSIRENYKGKIALILTSDKTPLKAETTRINKIFCSDGFFADINLI